MDLAPVSFDLRMLGVYDYRSSSCRDLVALRTRCSVCTTDVVSYGETDGRFTSFRLFSWLLRLNLIYWMGCLPTTSISDCGAWARMLVRFKVISEETGTDCFACVNLKKLALWPCSLSPYSVFSEVRLLTLLVLRLRFANRKSPCSWTPFSFSFNDPMFEGLMSSCTSHSFIFSVFCFLRLSDTDRYFSASLSSSALALSLSLILL